LQRRTTTKSQINGSLIQWTGRRQCLRCFREPAGERSVVRVGVIGRETRSELNHDLMPSDATWIIPVRELELARCSAPCRRQRPCEIDVDAQRKAALLRRQTAPPPGCT
jgi:hypothetical protein